MPSNLPSGHVHTFLGLHKSNTGAAIGAGWVAVIVTLLGAVVIAVHNGLQSGTLALPPSLAPYAPWIVLILGAIVTAFFQSGVPAFHPGQSQPGAPERPPVVHLPNEPPRGG